MRIVKPAEILAAASAKAKTDLVAAKLLKRINPPGTPFSKTRQGYVTGYNPANHTCTALIGDQTTPISNIPVLADVVPVLNAPGQFAQVSGDSTTEYTLTGMLVQAPAAVRIRKPTTQGVSNVGVVQSDTALNFYGLANRAYICEALLLVSQNSTATMDFLVGWNLPAGATWSGNAGPGPDLTVAASGTGSGKWLGFLNSLPGAASAFGIAKVSGQITLVPWHGTILMGANSGQCSMCWAQNTPLSATTAVNAGSYLKVDMAS